MTLTIASEAADVVADLSAFIQDSPSSYHAADTVRRRLVSAGFTELHEQDAWDLEPGGRHLVVRDGAVIAWVMPSGGAGGASTAGEVPGFAVFGAHTDSPAFKLKPNPGFTADGALQAGVEIYGGPLLNSWLDRELCLAGRIVTREGAQHLVRTPAIARIPQLAIHLDRQVNEKLSLDRQRHVQPVLGLQDLLESADPSTAVLEALAAAAGIAVRDIAGFDVYTIAQQPPAVFGLHDEFFASPRLDNLASVHAGASALALIDPAQLQEIAMLAAFDHEEVGSESRSGASGPFLADMTERILAASARGLSLESRLGAESAGAGAELSGTGAKRAGLGGESERELWLRSMARSVCFSADAGHGAHPNYPERHDPVNRPRLGRGPLLKINAQQRYATDAVGTALFAAACAAAGVEGQEFVSNNALPCGSTIGPLTATRLGMTTVDLGIPLWSMHSAREMCAVSDVADLFRLAHAFLSGA